MEKRADISSATPQPGKKTEKQAAADQIVKSSPTSNKQADKMEDSPMTRVSNAVSDAAKKK